MKHIIALLSLTCLAGLVSLVPVEGPVPVLTQADLAEILQVSRANDEFDMNLLNSLESENAGKNVFISAFSISSVLTMLMAGGKDKTYSEIYNALGFSKSQFANNQILHGYNLLLNELNHPTKDTGNVLSIANALAVQKNRAILESYLSSVTGTFGAQVFAEDFVTKSREATSELNQWVSEKTHGKIPKLFDELPQSTVMVLMNAIYFKGQWDLKFETKDTKSEPFHVTREASESVPFMTQRNKLNYAEFEDADLLELPYKNHTMSMYILLPKEGSTARQISSLLTATNSLEQRLSRRSIHDVTVHLPKFKFEGSYSLANTLTKLGITSAFSTSADFSNINGAHDLSVTAVVHKTYIDVNEEGSEAAAATGIVVGTTSVHPVPKSVQFRADRPFVFFIRDNQHQLTLFSGIINKPEYK